MLRTTLAAVAVAATFWAEAIAQDDSRECSSNDRDAYISAVRSRFYEQWDPPQYATAIRCTVLIKQNFRGEVLYVGTANCSEDPKVQKSIVDAAYLASPIPLPSNKGCFRRDVILEIESRVPEESR